MRGSKMEAGERVESASEEMGSRGPTWRNRIGFLFCFFFFHSCWRGGGKIGMPH